MSFFGFHNKAAPGFGQASDPFAGLSGGDDDAAIDFEDTYDGLGDQLDETDDAFNDDTFGSGGAGAVGKDFDFFGQTAKVANAIEEEQVRFNRQQPTKKTASAAPPIPISAKAQASSSYAPAKRAPARTGYEKYREPEQAPEMEVDASIWGTAAKKHHAPAPATAPAPAVAQPPAQAPGPAAIAAAAAAAAAAPATAAAAAPAAAKKFLSLEEVEAQMRAQAKAPHPSQSAAAAAAAPTESSPQSHYHMPGFPHTQTAWQQPPVDYGYQQPKAHQLEQPQQGHHVSVLQRPQQPSKQAPVSGSGPFTHQQAQQHQRPSQSTQPTQILQNPNRTTDHRMQMPMQPTHRQQNSFSRQAPPQIPPMPPMSEAERSVYLEQEAKRAKRNHKIFLMSRDNGLMTPQDKNFVSRIQLQQLVSATTNPNSEHGPEDINEDFYFQVLSQLRGGHRQNPNQPLNNFAQTYLFQTGNRQRGMRHGHGRIAENHVQRMEQQVQRAVEAAKTKPKNKQLVIEGSLGKISFSNAKTPKPLLNIKRTDSGAHHKTHTDKFDRKDILRGIEQVYNTLMDLEDLERKQPPPMSEDPAVMQQHAELIQQQNDLSNRLWTELKFHEPIGATPIHPFIVFLAFAKGKKAIPRIFRLVSTEQRKVILTMIIVHLDQLDVVRGGFEPNATMREAIELFQASVMPPLFAFMNDADLALAHGVLDILVRRVNIELVTRTRIGIAMLTMVLSRAEIIKNSGGVDERHWQEWVNVYNNFFDHLEPSLPHIFPGSVNAGEDIYVWQFLAAIGIGASPDQQQRLVVAVKDRVMETVSVAKTLPPSMAQQRLSHVNLFMRSIGLDVELLQ